MNVVIGTAGHIDHGKSALVRALTGIDPDRLKEEKARGITIDLGFAHYEAAGINFAFVDVPGHERFVKNMLAGASGIDHVLLVIAADESVMPQTREHFDICRLLKVSGGLIALTKADLVDEETIELVKLEARELVTGSFLQDAPMVVVSAKTGAGLDALRHELSNLGRSARGRSVHGPARLPIDRVFSIRGFGTVVTGTLVSGQVGVDDELVVLPAERKIKVRGVQVHGQKESRASAGQRTAVNLGGVEVEEIARGDALVTPGCFEVTREFDAMVELLPDARSLRHGDRVRFHHGTSELLGRVRISATVDSLADGTPVSIEILPGIQAYVRIRLESPAVLTRADRFILRAYSPSVTIGGGEVLDPHPPPGGIRAASARARFVRLHGRPAAGRSEDDRLDEAIVAMVEERGAAGFRITDLTRRAGVAPEAAARIMDRLEQRGRVTRAGDILVDPQLLSVLKDRLLYELRTYHKAQPLSEGLPREEARERLFGHAHAAVFDRVLADLVAARQIAARENLALVAHRVSLSAEEQEAREIIESAYRRGGLKPPDLGSLAASTGLSPEVIDRVTKLLLRQKILVKLDSLLFHSESLQRLKQEVSTLKMGEPARVDVATFKERYGISRKFAIPLLEYLDRERVTRRVGEARIVI